MKELTIPLQPKNGISLYEQIYEYIKNDISDGKLSPGEKLPSTRLLAKHLQVSRSTVELAYEQLLSEGYLKSIPCSGYYTCDIEGGFPEGAWVRENQKKKALPAAAATEEERLRYDFSPNTVEWPEFAQNAWRKATKSMLAEDMGELFSPGSSLGEENLRQVLCEYLHQARGVDCEIHQIMIGAGNEYLLMLLHQMLTEGNSIAMESPTYRQAYQTFCNLGVRVLAVPMDESGMDVAKLRESQAKLAYIMPSHQFPLGNVMPMKRRMELLQWAGEGEDRYIIEDDYDSEFRYRGKPIPSLQGSDPYGRVIYLGTFSKSIAPAVRVSYMVLPPGLTELYHKRCGFYSSTVSRVQQQTLYYFLKDGYFERHLNKMRGIYRARHDALLNALKGKDWVKRIFGENAGLHVLVEVCTQKPEEQLIKEAKKAGVRVYGMGEYTIRPETAACPTLLLGYAGLTEEQITRGLELFGETLDSVHYK